MLDLQRRAGNTAVGLSVQRGFPGFGAPPGKSASTGGGLGGVLGGLLGRFGKAMASVQDTARTSEQPSAGGGNPDRLELPGGSPADGSDRAAAAGAAVRMGPIALEHAPASEGGAGEPEPDRAADVDVDVRIASSAAGRAIRPPAPPSDRSFAGPAVGVFSATSDALRGASGSLADGVGAAARPLLVEAVGNRSSTLARAARRAAGELGIGGQPGPHELGEDLGAIGGLIVGVRAGARVYHHTRAAGWTGDPSRLFRPHGPEQAAALEAAFPMFAAAARQAEAAVDREVLRGPGAAVFAGAYARSFGRALSAGASGRMGGGSRELQRNGPEVRRAYDVLNGGRAGAVGGLVERASAQLRGRFESDPGAAEEVFALLGRAGPTARARDAWSGLGEIAGRIVAGTGLAALHDRFADPAGADNVRHHLGLEDLAGAFPQFALPARLLATQVQRAAGAG